MKLISILTSKRCLLWHRWRLFHDTGAIKYHYCKDCQSRKAVQYTKGYQSINLDWLYGNIDNFY